MKIKFCVDTEFQNGISRLSSLLGYEESDDGILLKAVCGNRVGTSFVNGVGTIYFKETHHFFRELGVFVQNMKEKAEFDITEDDFFQTIGVMFNTSGAAIPTVSTLQQMIDYLAIMGYNLMMLYTEDTVELENRPYFGLMRGRYTKEELRAIDDYAFDYGIEVIPCLECYGHMGAYLMWDEAKPIKDTSTVLLAREEKTFAFLDELIGEVSSCFRSKRIHIGMDEAHDMGRGEFLDRNGYVPRADIFNEYMERLVSITNKYGLTPMMWSDMYFRFNSSDGMQYYGEDISISEQTKRRIPKEVQLVFWHYGEEPHCDDYMMKKHQELDRDVIFAGGLWDWSGHFPEHNYAYESMKFSLEACRRNGVHEMMVTSWSSQLFFTNLLGLSFSAELCYRENASCDDLRDRFEICTGGVYEAFYNMSYYHNKFDEKERYDDFNDRFLGKHLFWQDIMEGLYDTHLIGRPMSSHYKIYAEKMRQYQGQWSELYEFAETVYSYLAVKTEIAEKLVPSYKNGDLETLKSISQTLLPSLKTLTEQLRGMYRDMWFASYKKTGWCNYDYLYGGMIARCETAKVLIDDYLVGKSDSIEELDMPRLYKKLSGFGGYRCLAMPFG